MTDAELAGTNVLWPTGSVRTPAGMKPGVRTGWRVGANSLEGVGMNLGPNIQVGTKLLELGPDKIVLDFRVFEGATRKVVTSQQLSLQNYQEALIEFAAAASGGKRLALRIIPSITAIPPVPDYPSTLQYLGFKDGLLIRNRVLRKIKRGGHPPIM